MFKSWTLYNDYIEGVKMGGKNCFIMYLLGWLISIPMSFHLIYSLVVYITDVYNQRVYKAEGVFLLINFYFQWKVLRYILNYIVLHRNETILNQEKAAFERDAASLEAYTEAGFQVGLLKFILHSPIKTM